MDQEELPALVVVELFEPARPLGMSSSDGPEDQSVFGLEGGSGFQSDQSLPQNSSLVVSGVQSILVLVLLPGEN